MLGLVNDPNYRKTDLNSIQASQELTEKIIQIGENAQEGGFRRHGGLAFLFP
jgi:hypothetical protein